MTKIYTLLSDSLSIMQTFKLYRRQTSKVKVITILIIFSPEATQYVYEEVK